MLAFPGYLIDAVQKKWKCLLAASSFTWVCWLLVDIDYFFDPKALKFWEPFVIYAFNKGILGFKKSQHPQVLCKYPKPLENV